MKRFYAIFAAMLISICSFASRDVVPADAVLADYYDQGNVCVCIFVPADMACNDIVLTGSFNGWSSTVAECAAVEPVEGYDGWYVASFEAEAEPDAEKGMQAKPIMLDVDGNFNWEYQIGAATAIRGGVQVVQGAYVGEIDMINYGADAPNVFTVDAWKQNPCTAVYHNYNVTVVSDGCGGYVVPFIVGGMNAWTFQQMQYSSAKTAEYGGVPTYEISFNAPEGTPYQIVSGKLNDSGEMEVEPGWNDDSYMQMLVDGAWVRIPGEDGGNQLTHENANIVWDLREDNLCWARCNDDYREVTLTGITWGYISNYGNINGDWSGTLPANTQISIECYPDNYPPYCGTFEGWSDGVTSNYRSFYLTQDTTISAIVSGRESYQVSITAGEHGYLSNRYVGTRMPCQGDLSVEAYPNHGYRFAQWSDGVTDNPRTIELSQDTTITAEFEQYLYTNVKIGDLYYDLNFEDKTAIVLGANGASDGANTVSVTDRSIAEWNELPQEYVFEANRPADAAYLGLKSVKVYADQDYINILVEPDMNELPDLEWVPFQVFIDADNSDATGGYGDMFTDPNADIYCEGAVFAEGQPYSYNPAVYKWWGEVGGSGWEWTDRSVEHDGSDYWGAIIGEGQLPVGNSQYVDGKFEIQLSRELLATAHPMNDTEFGIGFSIMQNWESVGLLPCASPTDANPSGYVAKLKVRINKNAIPAETSELELNPNLVIPSSVTYNDENYTVTTITREAFKNHTELTSVEIPTTMTYIAYDAFEGCDSITSVVWNAINCNTYRFGSQVESFVFGNEVEVIPDELCYGMHRLTSIVVPDGVTRIGYEAFANCSNLTHLYIPATVEEIGEHNLLWDMQLTHLTAPASVFAGYEGYDYYDISYYVTRYLAEYAPYHSHQLDTLIINHGELDAYSYGTIALSNKTMHHMDLGGTENTELQDEAFAHFYNLRSLVLPQGLEKINYMAIANCKSLESITIPASVTEIGMSAFEDCRSLLSVNFEAGSMLTKISDWAFYNCHELQSIAIPEGVTEIGKAAFFDCVYLNNVIVPASVQAIGDNAFALCARMQQMRVKAVVPPSIASKTFEQVSREMPVYVPMNSVNAYKADPLWGEMNIIGVDEQWDAVDNITTSTVITKQLINGQLYILRGDKTYSVQGQEVK